jgi:glucose-6-phosphate dehydrogenase assembly protein OpcA
MNGEPKQVSIGSIRKELQQLWASEAMQDKAVLRAQTHNLVIYIRDQATAEETTRRVVELTAEHPGRVIVIDTTPGEERTELNAWVTIYCRAVGDKQVCGEMITLGVPKDVRDEVHSTVVSLLVPNLPVYLWWTGIPDPGDHLFKELSQAADHVLVDSATFSDVAQGFKAIAGLGDIQLGDLNWARLTPWRQRMAQVWDMAEIREALEQIKYLDVHHIAIGDFKNSSRGLLLVGWLASRLDWELASAQAAPTGGYITYWRKGLWEGKVEIVESTLSGVDPGEIVGVFIQAGDHPPYVMPRLELLPQESCIETRIDDAAPDAPRLCNTYNRVSTAMALAEEINVGYDPYYMSALKHAANIIKQAAR